MIDLQSIVWDPINLIKSPNPVEGDLYYDSNINRNYIYNGGKWLELQINRSITISGANNRKRKIRKIFNG